MARNPKILKPRSAENKTLSDSVSEFDKLLRFIVNFQGRFALAFICGEDHRQREGVLASLADLLKEKHLNLRHIDLTFRQATDLLTTLKQEYSQTENAAIVVTAVEQSLNSNFLASLNVQRDLISVQIRCPILFWVSTFALNLFAREAPDFYDFRQTVFNFPGTQPNEAFRTTDITPQVTLPLESPVKGLAERTSYLLRQ